MHLFLSTLCSSIRFLLPQHPRPLEVQGGMSIPSSPIIHPRNQLSAQPWYEHFFHRALKCSIIFIPPQCSETLSFPCASPPPHISLLNKRWEADNEIQMPSRPAMSPANFSVGHFFFFFKQTAAMVWWFGARGHIQMASLPVGSRYILFTHFSPWIQGSNSIFQLPCRQFFKYVSNAKGPVHIRPLEVWEPSHSVIFFLRIRTVWN